MKAESVGKGQAFGIRSVLFPFVPSSIDKSGLSGLWLRAGKWREHEYLKRAKEAEWID